MLPLYFIWEVNSTKSCMLPIQRALAGYVYMDKEKILEDTDSRFSLPKSLKDFWHLPQILSEPPESAKFSWELLENLQ